MRYVFVGDEGIAGDEDLDPPTESNGYREIKGVDGFKVFAFYRKFASFSTRWEAFMERSIGAAAPFLDVDFHYIPAAFEVQFINWLCKHSLALVALESRLPSNLSEVSRVLGNSRLSSLENWVNPRGLQRACNLAT